MTLLQSRARHIVNNKQKINVDRDVNKINELLYACMHELSTIHWYAVYHFGINKVIIN